MPNIFDNANLAKYAATVDPNQSTPQVQNPNPGLPGMMQAGLVGSNLFDAATTNRAIASGGHEVDPLLQGASKNPGLMYGVKGGLGLAEAYGLNKLSRAGHPTLAKGLSLAAMAVPTLAGIHNLGVK